MSKIRWPWNKKKGLIKSPYPELWSDEEWTDVIKEEKKRWDTIMEPAICNFENAEKELCNAMGLPEPAPLPRPNFVDE